MYVKPPQLRQRSQRANVRDRILTNYELCEFRESAQWTYITDPVGMEIKLCEFRELTERADVRDQPVDNAEPGQACEILDPLKAFERMRRRRSQRASINDARYVCVYCQFRQLRCKAATDVLLRIDRERSSNHLLQVWIREPDDGCGPMIPAVIGGLKNLS